MDKKLTLTLIGLVAAATSQAQIPDLMTALDAGGRAMALGGGTYNTDATTWSINGNPAALGFIRNPMFGAAFRNLPESRTSASGNFDDQNLSTELKTGANGITHLGYATPMFGGTLGISFTRTGFIRDEKFGDGLPSGNLTVRNYEDFLKAYTDQYTISWGKSMGDGNTNFGAGLVFASQYLNSHLLYDLFNGNQYVSTVSSDNSGNGFGVGAVAGIIFSPAGSKTSVGLSLQTPIDLSDNGDTAAFYDRIPGRLSGSFAARTDAGGDSPDYLLYGIQADHYYGGQSDKLVSRTNYTKIGGGLEYGMHRWGARIPIRVGYVVVPDGGEGFGNRDAFTFGFGYRPNNSEFSIDLSFAKPVDGSDFDMALSITLFTSGN